MALVELPIKSSSHNRAILESGSESGQMERPEFRVRVLEDKNIAGRERRPVIHLPATTWREKMREPHTMSGRNLFGSGVSRDTNHDNFGDWCELNQIGNEEGQILRVVPRGDHEADGNVLLRPSDLSDHSSADTCGCLSNSGSFKRES